jgi:hypothetical protein
MIYRCGGFPDGLGSFDIGSAGFPTKLEHMELGEVIGLALALSVLKTGDYSVRQVSITDLDTALTINRNAAELLANWPVRFHAALKRGLPDDPKQLGALTLQNTFKNFYQYLLDNRQKSQFSFLHEAFEEFVSQHWPGNRQGPTSCSLSWGMPAAVGPCSAGSEDGCCHSTTSDGLGTSGHARGSIRQALKRSATRRMLG